MLRKIFLTSLLIVVLLITANLLKQIADAIKSSERLSTAANTVYQLEAKNRQLKQKLSQIQSAQFIEEMARNKLGLGKAGETVVIIPDSQLKLVLGASQSAKVRLPNSLGWWRVFNP